MSEYLPHLNAIGTAKFVLVMVLLIGFDIWYQIRKERCEHGK